jgi:nitric oxide reductase large subunit
MNILKTIKAFIFPSKQKVQLQNAKDANKFIFHYQNWLMVFALAELTFLGSIISSDNANIWDKIMISILLLSFLLFLFGANYQAKFLRDHVEKPSKKIESSPIAEKYFTFAQVLIFGVTLFLVLKIICS